MYTRISANRTVACSLLLAIFVSTLVVEGRRRDLYGGRVLNITPTECTSPNFPNVTGNCMISLECLQRSGTVIGACRNGLLFGACCHKPNEILTTTTNKVPVTESFMTDLESSTTISNVGRLELIESEPTTIKIPAVSEANEISTSPLMQTFFSNDLKVETKISSSESSPEITTIAPVIFSSPQRDESSTSENLPTPTEITYYENRISQKENEKLSSISNEHLSTFYNTRSSAEGTTMRNSAEPIASSIFVESTTSSGEGTTERVSTTTKFFYGKIKYSPKPIKHRMTTRKTLWTRPPTTETSYSIFKSSSDEEEEDDTQNEKENLKSTPSASTRLTTLTASTETTTLPQKSAEETTTTIKITSLEAETAAPIQTQTQSVSSTTEQNILLENASNSTKSSPIKQSRISNNKIHGIDSSSYDESSSSSAGWDNKLDDFVNQVVEGIAEELDKSNIDDVVFKPKTTKTTTAKPTTTIQTTKKSKLVVTKAHKSRTKSKNAHSNKQHSSTSNKAKGSKHKPSKKVVTSQVDSDSAEQIVLDYRKACGVRPLVRQSRIVGGTPSTYGSWPWHALVKETVWWGIYSKIKCGGVLIGSRHVLTAAHCQPQQTGTLSVVLGVTDSDNPNTNSVTKGVRRVIRHPQFNPRSYENDIAILELDSPVEFKPHIVPICMPDSQESFEGKKGYVTGMGLLKHDGERPLILHEGEVDLQYELPTFSALGHWVLVYYNDQQNVDVPIVNNSECQSMFRRSGNMKPIQSSFICAGYPQGLKDSCGGDSGSYRNNPMRNYQRDDVPIINETEFFSGGPLSVRRENGQWVLAGTVSHGIKCAVANQPGVYMRTTWYKPWIEKVTRSSRGADSPKCYGPPGACEFPQARSGGLLETLFRVFRLARKLWSRK